MIQGEGSIQVHIAFDCVLVKPKEGQVVRGTITEQSPEGLTVELCAPGIICRVGVGELMKPQLWDEQQKKWLW